MRDREKDRERERYTVTELVSEATASPPASAVS